MLDYFKGLILDPIHNLATMLVGNDGVAKGIVTVAIIGILIRYGRLIPSLLFRALKKRCMVSVSIDRVGSVALFDYFTDLIGASKMIRDYKVQDAQFLFKNSPSKTHGVNLGKGFFFHKGKIYFYNRSEKENSSESARGPYQAITLSTFGFSPKAFKEIYGRHQYRFEPSEQLYFESFDGAGWRVEKDKSKTVHLCVNKDVKEKIDKAVKFFLDHKDWYDKRGLSHKLVVVLYGPPGTGKTALTRYISDITERHLLSAPINGMTPGNFKKMVSSASGTNAVVSFQDFDTNPAFLKREEGGGVEIVQEIETPRYTARSRNNVMTNTVVQKDGLDLSTILNTFQGDVPLEDLIAVFTTNHIDKIDPAFLRKGRVDLMIEVGPLQYDEVKEFWEFYYETTEPLPEGLKTISINAADLMGIFQENAFDKEGFIKELYPFTQITLQ